jgi:hypothetical protein
MRRRMACCAKADQKKDSSSTRWLLRKRHFCHSSMGERRCRRSVHLVGDIFVGIWDGDEWNAQCIIPHFPFHFYIQYFSRSPGASSESERGHLVRFEFEFELLLWYEHERWRDAGRGIRHHEKIHWHLNTFTV